VKCTDTFLFWQKCRFWKIGEKVVQHQAKYGETKFGMERFIGFLDLITIWFLSRFGKDQCIYLVQWDR
jgi:hypothetical protein